MSETQLKKTVLSVGGLDPTGGAGILLDVVATRSTGAHGAAVLTTATVQDGERFLSSEPMSSRTVLAMIQSVFCRLNVGAVKTGALGTAQIVETVADVAGDPLSPPLVVDPVIASTSGGVLLSDEGVEALRDRLLPKATLITPNLAEAGILAGDEIGDLDGMRWAAQRLVKLGAGAVLVKGGHMKGKEIADLFLSGSGQEEVFWDERIITSDVRGTGCALASLIAGFVAQDIKILDAVARARKILKGAIRNAACPGEGPLVLSSF